MRRRRVSASRQAWIRPLAVALTALVLASGLFVAGVGAGGLHEWLALAAPPTAYLLVGVGMWRRMPLAARLKWAALTYAVHLVLGVALAAVFVAIRPVGLADALALVFWSFVPAPAILMLAAPLIVPRPRAVTRWLRTRDPLRREPRLVPPPLVVVGERAALSFPAEDSLAQPTAAQLAFAPPPAATTPPSAAAPSRPAAAQPSDEVPVPDKERDQGPIDSEPVQVDGELLIRIPFARVASQLPGNAFVLPPDRLAASLREPHHLVIPLRLILPQLAEGGVEIAWALVEAQFPELAFAAAAHEFEDRFPKLRLTLPIDEIVRQLPAGIFRVAAPAIDLHAIESFPPPFQPFLTTMESGASVAAELEQFLERARDPAPPPAPVGNEVARVVATVGTVEAEADDAAPDVEEGPAPRPIEVPAPDSEPEVPEAARVAARRIAASLAPVGSFEVAARRIGERLVLAFVMPALDTDAVFRHAAHVVPLAAAEGAETATLRGPRVALVVSGVRVAGEDALVVAAVPPGAPLALLELRMLRATAASRAGGAPDPLRVAPAAAARLRAADGAAERRLASLGAGPAGFGRVAPAVFVDGASGLNVYVFHGHGLEARTLGALASRVHAALAADVEGALGSMTFRQGRRRTVVRPVDETSSGPGVVAASGPVTLAGLAGRELERVAAALEAA